MEPHLHLLTDPRLSTVREKLVSMEGDLESIPTKSGDGVHAAVSVVLRGGSDLDLLLIRRAKSETDPWSGQMALPGGRQEPRDPSLLHTAIRETAEETALALEGTGVHLGRLEPTAPATKRLPPITIFPYVFGVPEEADARVSSREVDEVLWVPVYHLQDPRAADTVEIHYPEGNSRTFPCLNIDGRIVWGLTYRILTRFFALLSDQSPIK